MSTKIGMGIEKKDKQDDKVIALSLVIEEKNKEIDILSKMIEDKNKEISSLSNTIEERDKEIESLQSSEGGAEDGTNAKISDGGTGKSNTKKTK